MRTTLILLLAFFAAPRAHGDMLPDVGTLAGDIVETLPDKVGTDHARAKLGDFIPGYRFLADGVRSKSVAGEAALEFVEAREALKLREREAAAARAAYASKKALAKSFSLGESSELMIAADAEDD